MTCHSPPVAGSSSSNPRPSSSPNSASWSWERTLATWCGGKMKPHDTNHDPITKGLHQCNLKPFSPRTCQACIHPHGSRNPAPTSHWSRRRQRALAVQGDDRSSNVCSDSNQANITFTMSTLAQHLQNPTWTRWEEVKRVVQYLKMTCNLELMYSASDMRAVGYMDVDHTSQMH